MPKFCAATGLQVVTKPEWVSQKLSETFEANFNIIADSVIYSRPKGYADLNSVKKSIKILDEIVNIVSEGDKPYIQIEDYSYIEGSSIDARRYVAEKMNEDPRRKALIFCNASLPISIAVKLYSRLISIDLDIQVVKSYKNAIELALKTLQIEKVDLDHHIFKICRNYKKDASSLHPVDILTGKFLNIQDQGYACPSFIVEKCILYSTNIGYFQEKHIPLIGNMVAECHTTFRDVLIEYNVVDCQDFKGIHPNARIKHMEAMKKWHQQFPLKMLIMYGVSTSMKAALYIANALMPFKVRVAENIEHAFQIINEDKKDTKVTITKTSQEPLSITRSDIDGLITRIGSLHWDEDFEDSMDIDDVENTDHPLSHIYTSINLIKEEIDELFKERKHVEERLTLMAKEWQTTFDTASDAIFLLDQDMRIKRANKKAEQLFKDFDGGIMGKYCYEVVHGIDQPIAGCPNKHSMQNLCSESMELQFGENWFRVTVDPFIDKCDRYIGGVHIITDITEIKSFTDSLQKSEEKFKFFAENMGDIVWTLDMDFKATYVSPSVEKVLGFTVEERKQQKMEDMVTPESFDQIMAKFLEEMEREKMSGVDTDRSINIDVEYFHKNGSIVWMENVIKAIRNESNEIIGLYGVSRDITERKNAENALRESQEFISSVLDALQAGVLLIEKDSHQIFHVNSYAAQLIGRSKKEIIGNVCHDFICPSAEGKCPITDLNQTIDHTERKLLGKNNIQIPILKSVVQSRFNDKDILIECFVDITMQKNIAIEREALIERLQSTLDEVKQLSGLFPICANCKKIRDDKGYWNQIESYIQSHSEAKFSHGICPECSDELYGNEPWYIDTKNKKE